MTTCLLAEIFNNFKTALLILGFKNIKAQNITNQNILAISRLENKFISNVLPPIKTSFTYGTVHSEQF